MVRKWAAGIGRLSPPPAGSAARRPRQGTLRGRQNKAVQGLRPLLIAGEDGISRVGRKPGLSPPLLEPGVVVRERYEFCFQ